MVSEYVEYPEKLIRRLGKALPNPVIRFLKSTPVYHYSKKAVIERRELVRTPISYDGLETEALVPKLQRPWWKNYHAENRPFHEPLSTETYIEHVSEGDKFWDFGSRLGYETTVAAHLTGSPSNVHVFEGDYHNALNLRRMDRERFNGELNINNMKIDAESADILQEYAEENGYPDFVKMDIEGAEVEAFKGIEPFLGKKTPILLIEVHSSKIEDHFGSSVDELYSILKKYYPKIMFSRNFRSKEGEWVEADSDEIPTEPGQILCKND